MVGAAMDQETSFLIDLCARQRGLAPARPTEPGPLFDWESFADAADRHKVLGLAYRGFSSGLAPSPPAEVLASLKRQAAAKVAAKAMLLSEWCRVNEAFKSADTRVLTIKGPALALQLYGEAEEREYRDIDFLVDASTLEKAEAIFASLGFEAAKLDPNKNSSKRAYQLRKARHLTFTKPGLPGCIEVHGARKNHIGLAPITIDAAFERAEWLDFRGARLATLGRHDHCLVAMLHGTHHFWCLLQWVLDAMALLDHSSGELENPSRLWLDDDPAFAFEAFALLAGRIFVAPELGRFAPPHGIARWRASWLSDYFLSCLIAGGREKNKFRAALGRGFRVAMLRRGLGRKLGTLAWFFRPTASDLEHFNGDRLPLFLLYVARPFLLLARIARDLRSGGDGERV